MAAYPLTRRETQALCMLLHLPVQQGSLLSNWLGDGGLVDDLNQKDLDSLTAKGFYLPSTPATSFPVGLIASMTVTSLNAAELTVTFGSHEKAGLTRFAQLGEGLVEFGTDGDTLYLHRIVKMKELAGQFLPQWISVSQDEQVQVELPLGAYLLFKQACLASDLAFVESSFKSARFEKSALVELFQEGQDWVDIFNAEGLQGVLSIEQMPVEVYLNQLISLGYLQGETDGTLEIGTEGQALKEVLADPELCSLTCSMYIWGAGYPETGSFLYGGGRLFLLNIKPGIVSIQQLASREAGQARVEGLLAKGRQAHPANFVVNQVEKKPSASQRAPIPPVRRKPKRKISSKVIIALVLILLAACCLTVLGGAFILYGIAG